MPKNTIRKKYPVKVITAVVCKPIFAFYFGNTDFCLETVKQKSFYVSTLLSQLLVQ